MNALIRNTIGWTCCFLCIGSLTLTGQDTVKIKPRISLNFFQANDEIPYLTTRVRTRTETGWHPVEGVIVNLFLNAETKLGMMGNIISDLDGGGKFTLPDKFKFAWDSLDEFTFTARILNDVKVEDSRETIIIRKCKLTVDTKEKDSVRTLMVTFEEKRGPNWTGVSDVDLKPFVKRTFGRLPIGEDALVTDEDGFAEIEFSSKMPGDKNGVITLGWMLEDHEEFGSIIMTKSVAWGLPLIINTDFLEKRNLWTTRERTPIWLLVVPNAMILLVWGVIGYLVYQIVLIRRIYKKVSRSN